MTAYVLRPVEIRIHFRSFFAVFCVEFFCTRKREASSFSGVEATKHQEIHSTLLLCILVRVEIGKLLPALKSRSAWWNILRSYAGDFRAEREWSKRRFSSSGREKSSVASCEGKKGEGMERCSVVEVSGRNQTRSSLPLELFGPKSKRKRQSIRQFHRKSRRDFACRLSFSSTDNGPKKETSMTIRRRHRVWFCRRYQDNPARQKKS